MSYELWAMSYELWAELWASHELWAKSYELWAMSHELWVMNKSCELSASAISYQPSHQLDKSYELYMLKQRTDRAKSKIMLPMHSNPGVHRLHLIFPARSGSPTLWAKRSHLHRAMGTLAPCTTAHRLAWGHYTVSCVSMMKGIIFPLLSVISMLASVGLGLLNWLDCQ
jgi:hypothetical protein